MKNQRFHCSKPTCWGSWATSLWPLKSSSTYLKPRKSLQFFWPPIFVVFLSFIRLRKSRPMNDKKTGHFEKVRPLECRASVLLDLPWGESGPVGVRSVLLPVGFYSKGPPWLRLLMARVRLPQTSLMRSGRWSVPQPTPAASFPK